MLADVLGGTAGDCDYPALLIYFRAVIEGTLSLQDHGKICTVVLGTEAIIVFAWAK